MSESAKCTLPPNGWACTRESGHSGPCAAIPDQSQLQADIPLEVLSAVEDLLRAAKRHKVLVAGFVLGSEPPFVSNIGTCSDADKIELYTALCKMVEDKKARGLAIPHRVVELN